MSLKVNIKKNLGDFCLDINLEAKDEIVGLLGYSGSGKSMTLKMIAGIETPDEGCIILNNRVLFDKEKKINLKPQERNVGFMFQSYALFNHMSVYDNIGIGLRCNKDEKDALIREYSKILHIEDLLKRKPRQLSGGQKQRVALARVLAMKPEILMLDEPFSALDSYLRRSIKAEFKEILSSYKGTVLYVSHNRNEIYHYCQKVAVVSDGQMIEIKPTQELYTNCSTIVGAKLIGCRNIFPIEEARVGGYTHMGIKETDIILSKHNQNNEGRQAFLKRIEKMPEQVRLWLDIGWDDLLQYTCSLREYNQIEEWLENNELYAIIPADKVLLLK